MRSMRTPQLGGNDDNALIEAFRLEDNALFKKYEIHLKRACRKFGRRYDWLGDDLEGAANEAFAQALNNYDPTRGAFGPYLAKWVDGALRGVLEDRMRNGVKGSGRVGRWLSGAWDARKVLPPEQIAKLAKVSVETARRGLEAEHAIREGVVPYDTASGEDFPHEPGGGCFDGDDCLEVDEDTDKDGYLPRGDASWECYCERRAAAQLKPIGREQYERDQQMAHRHVESPAFAQGKPRLSSSRVPVVSDEYLQQCRKLDAEAQRQRDLGWASYTAGIGRAVIVVKGEPRLPLVIDNAPMAQKGTDRWHMRKHFNAASLSRFASTQA
jgi:Sigma-70 region 2